MLEVFTGGFYRMLKSEETPESCPPSEIGGFLFL